VSFAVGTRAPVGRLETFLLSVRSQEGVLLVIAYSQPARQSLRNVCRAHGDSVVDRFGRVALLAETEFGGFQAVRLREKHGDAVQVGRTRSFNEFRALRPAVREAALAYEERETPATPYERFAAGTDLPDPETMRGTEL
jgi:hypothetical protein